MKNLIIALMLTIMTSYQAFSFELSKEAPVFNEYLCMMLDSYEIQENQYKGCSIQARVQLSLITQEAQRIQSEAIYLKLTQLFSR